jgi:hypothetical protein
MKHPSPTEAVALIFAWRRAKSTSLSLPGFLLVAFFMHASSLYLFQVTYPSATTLPPRLAAVSLLNPANPAHHSMLEFATAEDPARIASGADDASPGQAALLPIAYRPSFAKEDIRLATPPASDGEIALPAAGRSGPLPLAMGSGRAHRADEVPVILPLTLSSELRVRAPGVLPPLPLPEGAWEPARYLLAVDSDGRVRHAIRQSSGGNSRETDLATVRYFAKLRFQPASETGLVWGEAIVSNP